MDTPNRKPDKYDTPMRFDEAVRVDPERAYIRTLMKSTLMTAFLMLSLAILGATVLFAPGVTLAMYRDLLYVLGIALVVNTALQLFIFWRVVRMKTANIEGE